ncbi:hypothetical protein EAG_05962 [Camponotus floridanus]|uniref:Uncharacterized protein n=1 Tax=Camponotus floridanus TaxID=104421 RepID=E2AY62_CAMFO|nr:hypothetical protein EAG_05962 [Camponotus floridanus]
MDYASIQFYSPFNPVVTIAAWNCRVVVQCLMLVLCNSICTSTGYEYPILENIEEKLPCTSICSPFGETINSSRGSSVLWKLFDPQCNGLECNANRVLLNEWIAEKGKSQSYARDLLSSNDDRDARYYITIIVFDMIGAPSPDMLFFILLCKSNKFWIDKRKPQERIDRYAARSTRAGLQGYKQQLSCRVQWPPLIGGKNYDKNAHIHNSLYKYVRYLDDPLSVPGKFALVPINFPIYVLCIPDMERVNVQSWISLYESEPERFEIFNIASSRWAHIASVYVVCVRVCLRWAGLGFVRDPRRMHDGEREKERLAIKFLSRIGWCNTIYDQITSSLSRSHTKGKLVTHVAPSWPHLRDVIQRELILHVTCYSLDYNFCITNIYAPCVQHTHTAAITPSYAENSRETAFYNGNGNLCRANVLAKFKVQLYVTCAARKKQALATDERIQSLPKIKVTLDKSDASHMMKELPQEEEASSARERLGETLWQFDLWPTYRVIALPIVEIEEKERFAKSRAEEKDFEYAYLNLERMPVKRILRNPHLTNDLSRNGIVIPTRMETGDCFSVPKFANFELFGNMLKIPTAYASTMLVMSYSKI